MSKSDFGLQFSVRSLCLWFEWINLSLAARMAFSYGIGKAYQPLFAALICACVWFLIPRIKWFQNFENSDTLQRTGIVWERILLIASIVLNVALIGGGVVLTLVLFQGAKSPATWWSQTRGMFESILIFLIGVAILSGALIKSFKRDLQEKPVSEKAIS